MPTTTGVTPRRATLPTLPYAFPGPGRRAGLRVGQAAMVAFAVGLVALLGTTDVRWTFVDISGGPVAAWGAVLLSWLVLLGLLVDEARSVRADAAGVVVHVRTTRTEIPWAAITQVTHTTTCLVVVTADGERREFALVSDDRRGDVAISTTPTAQVAADLDRLRRTAALGAGSSVTVQVRNRQPSVAARVLLIVAGALTAATALLCTVLVAV